MRQPATDGVIIESGLYSVRQLIEILHVGSHTVKRWQEEGLPISQRNTKSAYVRGRDVIDFLFANDTEEKKLVSFILSLGGSVTAAELFHRRRKMYRTKEGAQAALQGLVDKGFGEWAGGAIRKFVLTEALP